MYNPVIIANFFIGKAKELNVTVNSEKLQRLLYYAHGWFLALYDKILINDVVEYKKEPIFSSLSLKLKNFKELPITETITHNIEEEITDSELIIFLNNIWETYSNELPNLILPNEIKWYKETKKKNGIIKNEDIKNYFKKYNNLIPLTINEEDFKATKNYLHLTELEQNIGSRKKYAKILYWLLTIWLMIILSIVFSQGIGYHVFSVRPFNWWFEPLKFYLTDAVLITIITTTTANIAAFFLFVIKYLFDNNKTE